MGILSSLAKKIDTKSTGSVQVKDGLINIATGLGTARSKRQHAKWAFENLNNYPQYEACYEDSWIARRICDFVAEDLTKDWRRLKCKDAEKLRIAEDDLQVVSAFREAIRWARLYGGAGIVMITDQDMSQPLDINRIKKGSLKGLQVLDRFYLSGNADAQLVNDVLDPNFMKPQHYLVANSKDAYIHTSHIIKLIGEPLPMRRMIQQLGWGDSSLRQCLEPIEDFVSSVGGIAESMQEFNVDVIKRDGLFTDMDSDQDNAIIKRFETFGMMKSVLHLALLDGSEDFQRKSVSYAGVAEMSRILMHQIAGACRIPFTRLFGASAEGMNATGEGDDKNYTDYLDSLKNSRLDPALRLFDEVFVRSTLGTFPEDFNYDWGRIRKKGEIEEANANHIKAQTDQIYLDNGVISVSQIQRNLQTAETYSFDEARIEELEKYEQSMKAEELYGNGQGAEDEEDSGEGSVSEEDPNGVSNKASEDSK